MSAHGNVPRGHAIGRRRVVAALDEIGKAHDDANDAVDLEVGFELSEPFGESGKIVPESAAS